MGAKVPAGVTPLNTGDLIREYFAKYGEASATDVHKWIIQRQQQRLRATMPPGPLQEEYIRLVPQAVSYRGIVKWFYIMGELGITELSRSEPAHGFPKNFYRVKVSRLEEIEPGLPYKLYPSNIWGGKRYKSARGRGLLIYGREAPPVGKWAEEESI
ncbi:MAG: hypothetical protein ABIH46_07420 [Chloroflexota bacterium]